jgi:hypothetical protein
MALMLESFPDENARKPYGSRCPARLRSVKRFLTNDPPGLDVAGCFLRVGRLDRAKKSALSPDTEPEIGAVNAGCRGTHDGRLGE